MAIKGNARKVYTTMRGKVVDMELLQQKNELTPAVGNVRINARGDELGPGGKIVRKREDILRDYYEKNSRAATDSSTTQEPVVQEQGPKAGVKINKTTRAQQKLESPTAKEMAEIDEDWVEDENGNFVPKGK